MRTRTVVVLAFCAAGCGNIRGPIGERREVPPIRGGTLHLATLSDVRNLDPALAFDTTAQAIEQLLYAKLIDFDHDGNVKGELAESIEVSPDKKRYSFRLHEGALFHDGSEVTAEDVKRSIERALDHETPCPAPSFYASIVGYEEFHEGTKDAPGNVIYAPHLAGVVVDGRYTLHIDLTSPDATFLPAAALPLLAPVCKSAGAKYAREWGNNACGAGPFRLVEWRASREILLARHKGYFKPGLPYVDAIQWSLLMPKVTQRFKFEQGEIDHLRELGVPDLAAYLADSRWQSYRQWQPAKTIIGFFLNTQMQPFDNVELRRAVAAAINWNQIASAHPGTIIATSQMLPPAVPGYNPGFTGQKYDVADALEHMKKAGYAFNPRTGEGGYPEVVRYVGPADTVANEVMAPIAQQQLARIGIRLEIKQLSWPGFLAESSKRNSAQIGYAGWSMDFPDPSDFFEPILASSAIQEEDTQNQAFFSDPELDAVLKKAHNEGDPKERAALYRRCEEIVRDKAPWAIGLDQRYLELVQPYLHGYVADKAHEEDMREVWLDTSARPDQVALLRRHRVNPLAFIRPWGRR